MYYHVLALLVLAIIVFGSLGLAIHFELEAEEREEYELLVP